MISEVQKIDSRKVRVILILPIKLPAQWVDATSSTVIDIFEGGVMRRYGPPGLSAAERVDRGSRWRAGYHVRAIARAFGRDHGSMRGLLARRGGIAPSARIRGILTLTLREREDISRGVAAGESGRSDEFPDDESMRVCHETIYRSLFIQARGVLKKERARAKNALRGRRSIRNWRRIDVVYLNPDEIDIKGETDTEITLQRAA